MPIENEITKEEYTKALKKAEREKWEIEFAKQLEAKGLYLGKDPENLLPGEYTREFRWHPKRKWRSDFLIANPNRCVPIDDSTLILVEIEGGVWTRGRHTRGSGFIKDCEKYNNAAATGWRVFRFPSQMVEDGKAIKFLEEEVWKCN